jgi:Family of unknown function (DUF5329)
MLALVVPASAAMSPKQEIEALLTYVGGLKGASFVRNGTAYSAPEAEAHLRRKWSYAGSRLSTAEEFIRYCATKSSVSGVEYVIRFSDGREEPSARVLLNELQRIRAKSSAGPDAK